MITILIIVLLVVLILGAYPHGPWYGANPPGWGYYPMGGLGIVLIVILLLILFRGPLW